VASAAGAEVAACWRGALGRGRDDCIGFRCGVAAFVVGDVNEHLFAGQRERNEDGLAVNSREKRAAVDGLLNCNGLGDLRELGLRGLRTARALGCALSSALLHCWLM
jgi:hypothetical protein